jgi:pyridoxal-phosphate dependent enzyme
MAAPVRPQDLDKWWSDARYHCFRAAFQDAKRNTSGWSDRKLHRGCEAIAETHAGLWVPSLSTVERFGERSADVQSTLRGKPRSLSCLLIAAAEVVTNCPEVTALARDFLAAFDFSLAIAPRVGAPSRRAYTRTQLEDILAAIGARTANKVDLPEFPPFNRRFPATNTKRLNIGGREILLKDESELPTGTHKARRAWEKIVGYKPIIRAELANGGPMWLPAYSIISSGSDAAALQFFLRQFGLPDLRVVMDQARAKEDVLSLLEQLGAQVFPVDLEEHELTSEDVLGLTKNAEGVDATSWDITTADRNTYYDWLAYEILNLAPKHIFVPVGTGELFSNLAFVVHRHLCERAWDERLNAPIEQVNIYGATTENPNSKMVMLYAKWRPVLRKLRETLQDFKRAGALGEASGVFAIDDELAERALLQIQRQALPPETRAMYGAIRSDVSGIAGLALYLQRAHEIPEGETVVVVNTGCLDLASN